MVKISCFNSNSNFELIKHQINIIFSYIQLTELKLQPTIYYDSLKIKEFDNYLILIEIMIGSISYEDHSKEEKLLVLN